VTLLDAGLITYHVSNLCPMGSLSSETDKIGKDLGKLTAE